MWPAGFQSVKTVALLYGAAGEPPFSCSPTLLSNSMPHVAVLVPYAPFRIALKASHWHARNTSTVLGRIGWTVEGPRHLFSALCVPSGLGLSFRTLRGSGGMNPRCY